MCDHRPTFLLILLLLSSQLFAQQKLKSEALDFGFIHQLGGEEQPLAADEPQAFVLLNNNKCTFCYSQVPDLVQQLKNEGYATITLIVAVGPNLLQQKLFANQLERNFDLGVPIGYLSDSFKSRGVDWEYASGPLKTLHFSESPALLLSQPGQYQYFASNVLFDQQGQLIRRPAIIAP